MPTYFIDLKTGHLTPTEYYNDIYKAQVDEEKGEAATLVIVKEFEYQLAEYEDINEDDNKLIVGAVIEITAEDRDRVEEEIEYDELDSFDKSDKFDVIWTATATEKVELKCKNEREKHVELNIQSTINYFESIICGDYLQLSADDMSQTIRNHISLDLHNAFGVPGVLRRTLDRNSKLEIREELKTADDTCVICIDTISVDAIIR